MFDEERSQKSGLRSQSAFARTSGDAASDPSARGDDRESGAATVEYFLIVALVTAMVIAMLNFLYPGGARNFETLVNAWGDRLATHIAGDKIDADSTAWKEE